MPRIPSKESVINRGIYNSHVNLLKKMKDGRKKALKMCEKNIRRTRGLIQSSVNPQLEWYKRELHRLLKFQEKLKTDEVVSHYILSIQKVVDEWNKVYCKWEDSFIRKTSVKQKYVQAKELSHIAFKFVCMHETLIINQTVVVCTKDPIYLQNLLYSMSNQKYPHVKFYWDGIQLNEERDLSEQLWFHKKNTFHKLPLVEIVVGKANPSEISELKNPDFESIEFEEKSYAKRMKVLSDAYCEFMGYTVSRSRDELKTSAICRGSYEIPPGDYICNCIDPEYYVDERESVISCTQCGLSIHDALNIVAEETRCNEVAFSGHMRQKIIRRYRRREHFMRIFAASGPRSGSQCDYNKIANDVEVEYQARYHNDKNYDYMVPERIKKCMSVLGYSNYNIKYTILSILKNRVNNPIFKKRYQEPTQTDRERFINCYDQLEKAWDQIVGNRKKYNKDELYQSIFKEKNFVNYEMVVFWLARHLKAKHLSVYYHSKRMKTETSRERQEKLLRALFAYNGWDIPPLGEIV